MTTHSEKLMSVMRRRWIYVYMAPIIVVILFICTIQYTLPSFTISKSPNMHQVFIAASVMQNRKLGLKEFDERMRNESARPFLLIANWINCDNAVRQLVALHAIWCIFHSPEAMEFSALSQTDKIEFQDAGLPDALYERITNHQDKLHKLELMTLIILQDNRAIQYSERILKQNDQLSSMLSYLIVRNFDLDPETKDKFSAYIIGR